MHTLSGHACPIVIGRGRAADVRLRDDAKVSRLHARLFHDAGRWLLEDDGTSRNGTYVNGERVHGRCVLADRDRLCFGHTRMVFCVDTGATERRTAAILVALAETADLPPTNTTIAARIGSDVATVRSHLADLYARHGLATLPESIARRRLCALARGGAR